MSRGRKSTVQPGARWVTGICSSGKRSHADRHSAKAHARSLRGQHLREYFCDVCGGWHVGHLPRAVLQGMMSAADYYG
jgi:hypothetical protein